MVYLGFDPQIERLVALKTIRVDGISPDSSSEFVVRFRNEARAAGRLQHPNIVGIYEYGADESVAFIVWSTSKDLRRAVEALLARL